MAVPRRHGTEHGRSDGDQSLLDIVDTIAGFSKIIDGVRRILKGHEIPVPFDGSILNAAFEGPLLLRMALTASFPPFCGLFGAMLAL